MVDSDYRGKIQMLLINNGTKVFNVSHRDRVAQLVIHSLPPAPLEESMQSLELTERGAGGFGSTDRVHTGDGKPSKLVGSERSRLGGTKK